MANSVEFKNVTVSFSTMLNKLDNKLFGRMFSVKIPMDSPELKKLQEQFTELNTIAKKAYSEEHGVKVKDASREKGAGRDLFEESAYAEGFAELKFNIVNVRDKEVTDENGKTTKSRYEVLNKIYKSLDFIYKINNNGEKEFSTEKGNHWVPLNTNVIDLKCSLVASYDEKDKRPRIQLKADEVKILESTIGSKTTSNKVTYLTLDGVDEEAETKVENKKPSKKDEELISSEELGAWDI